MTHTDSRRSPKRKSSPTKRPKKTTTLRTSHKRSSSPRAKNICRDYLGKKIKINLDEYKKGIRHSSEKQAIAVSYAQTFKAKPSCKKLIGRKKSSQKK